MKNIANMTLTFTLLNVQINLIKKLKDTGRLENLWASIFILSAIKKVVLSRVIKAYKEYSVSDDIFLGLSVH